MTRSEMDPFIKLVSSKRKGDYEVDGKLIRMGYHKGAFLIKFLNSGSQACVTIKVEPFRTLHIENYYHTVAIQNCPYISHDWFFNDFLIPLAEGLECTEINLIDRSSKDLTHCPNVPFMIFAMAKGRTFYEIYQFENEEYSMFIDTLRDTTLENFHEECKELKLPNIPSKNDVETLARELDGKTDLETVAKEIIKRCSLTNKENLLTQFLDLLIAYQKRAYTGRFMWKYVVSPTKHRYGGTKRKRPRAAATLKRKHHFQW